MPFTSTSAGVARRRALNIEEIVREVVVDELPKRRDDDTHEGAGFRSMHPMWKAGLFPRVDNWSRAPGMPLALGDPSDDALAIEKVWLTIDPAALNLSAYAVTAGYEIALRDPRRSGVNYADILASACEELAIIVHSAAVQRRAPDWMAELHHEPVCGGMGRVSLWRTVSREAGKGKDGTPWFTTSDERTTMAGGGLYKKGTFCKLRIVSGAADVIEARLRYALWHAFLSELTVRLAAATKVILVEGEERVVPLLDTIDPRAALAPATPWIVPPRTPRTLLATPGCWDREERRPHPVPPPTRPGHGPVRVIPVDLPLAA